MDVIGKIQTIGICSPIDIGAFMDYFTEEEQLRRLERLRIKECAPSVITLCKTYLRNGYNLKIFTLADETRVFTSKNKQITIFTVKACNSYPQKYLWGIFNNYRNLKRVIAENIDGIDIFHSNWTYEYTLAASSQNKVPIVCTVRDWTPLIFKMVNTKDKITWAFRYIANELVFARKNIHFVGNSPYTSNLIKKKLFQDVLTIPNSVKDSFFNLEPHRQPARLHVLCITSGNDKRKNIHTLLKAFHSILLTDASAMLTIIGPGFEDGKSNVEQWKKQGLINNVERTGIIAHDKLREYLDKATMLVIPSLEETFGNTLLEGLSRGTPVIGGKKSGAVPYVLQEGKIGYLCDVTSSESIKNMILYVANHYDEALTKATIGKRVLQNNYSEQAIANQYIQLFNRIIKEKS